MRVFPVAGGCGIVELWDGMLGRARVRGFSARTWDPRDSTWTLVLNWPQPGGAGFSTLRGRFRHGRGEFFSESDGPNGPLLTRYTFADIGPDRFRWNDGASRDSGGTWQTQWIMEYARRPAGARPVLNAALATAADDPICGQEPAAATEPLLGRWRNPAGASLVVVRAIGGCAVLAMLEWPSDEGRQELFAILGHDDRASQWTAWALSTRHRGFQELAGSEAAALTGVRGGLRWERRSDTELALEWTGPAGEAHAFTSRRPGRGP